MLSGPPSPSIIYGNHIDPSQPTVLLLTKVSLLIGHFKQIYNTNGWDFHDDLLKNYGGVVRLKGILKVYLSIIQANSITHSNLGTYV